MTRALKIVLVTAAIASGCSATGVSSDDIVLMAPSSMVDVIESIVDDQPVTPTYAGSSSLVAQLRDGARADILITASRETMQVAIDTNSVLGEPRLLTTNHLVVAVADGNPGAITAIADLAQPNRLVGMCSIEVPCGALAAEALHALELTVSADTFEPNVRSLATKILLGELDVGLIYRTDADALGLEVVEADGLSEFTTEYLIASVSGRPEPEIEALIEHLISSAPIRAVLDNLGFGPP